MAGYGRLTRAGAHRLCFPWPTCLSSLARRLGFFCGGAFLGRGNLGSWAKERKLLGTLGTAVEPQISYLQGSCYGYMCKTGVGDVIHLGKGP